MEAAAASIVRSKLGRFVPGHSGNPAGRPKGARNRATLFAEALEAGEDVALARRLIDLGHDGDRAALRFVLGRLVPPPRGRVIPFDLPDGLEARPQAVFRRVVRLLAEGAITPDEALAAGRFLACRARIPSGLGEHDEEDWEEQEIEEELEGRSEPHPILDSRPACGGMQEGGSPPEAAPLERCSMRRVPPPALSSEHARAAASGEAGEEWIGSASGAGMSPGAEEATDGAALDPVNHLYSQADQGLASATLDDAAAPDAPPAPPPLDHLYSQAEQAPCSAAGAAPPPRRNRTIRGFIAAPGSPWARW
jgi:hypothetical protein